MDTWSTDMAWWEAEYPSFQRRYNSEQIPLLALPDLVEVNKHEGHRFRSKDIIITGRNIEVDLRLGVIWLPDRQPLMVSGGCRVILYRKVTRNMLTKELIRYDLHLGLLDEYGSGFEIVATEDGGVTIITRPGNPPPKQYQLESGEENGLDLVGD